MNRRLRFTSFLAVALAWAIVRPAAAQDAGTPLMGGQKPRPQPVRPNPAQNPGLPPKAGAPAGARNPVNLERWKALSPEKRKELLAKWNRWKALGPDERARILDNIKRWQSLPPERRRDLRRKLQELPPPLRQRLEQRVDQVGQLPGPKREAMRHLVGLLSKLSPQERERIRSLAPPERQRALQRLVEEHYLQHGVKSDEERQAILALPPDKRWGRIRQNVLERLGRPRPEEGAVPPRERGPGK